MGDQTLQTLSRAAWALARSQHGLIARWQLLELGFSAKAIKHRIVKGRLHPVYRGVYAVGRPELTQEGRWMAGVLACGPGAYLSHLCAATHWKIRLAPRGGPIDISLNAAVVRRPPGIRVHRTATLTDEDLTIHHNIPITSPTRTLIGLGTVLTPSRLEAAVNEADKLDLVDPETLRAALEKRAGQPGVAKLRALLDRDTFRLTDSDLERRFLALVRRAGLPPPQTQVQLNGFRVDFFWPELGLVVEADGLRYHRTPAQQARNNLRDQAHTAAGLTPVRFSHAEVRYEARRVATILADISTRLRAGSAPHKL